MIKELYEINNGFFDPLFGSIELPKPDGEAKTFVICGNGTGIPIFRQLQKEHTPFIADYPLTAFHGFLRFQEGFFADFHEGFFRDHL